MKPKPSKLNIKVGEWCFCEFKLQEIREVTNGRITSVSDGVCVMGGDSTSVCFPLDVNIKRISDSVLYWSKKFHETTLGGINHPDLNRKMIAIWVEMCRVKDDEKLLKEKYEFLNHFTKVVLDKIKIAEEMTAYDVKLFRKVIN